MAKMKRLINFGLPVTACNMRCSYCYVSQMKWNAGELGSLDYSPEYIQTCMTKERLGGICHINMCGSGETLLPQYTIELARRMLENGHYITIVTNGTITNRIKEICDFPEEYKKRIFIKFSLHYFELKRLNMLDLFFQNIRYVRDNGCAFSVELGAADEYIPIVDEIQKVCIENVGGPPFAIELRKQYDFEEYSRLTELPLEEHQNGYRKIHTEMFNFQQEHWGKERCEFCYAGDWAVQMEAKTGWFRPCFIGGELIQNIYENPKEAIRFTAIGENCPWKHCYSGHILLSSGVVPSLNTPTYAKFRDHQDEKGNHWLTPSILEFFSSQFIDSNSEYSETKKKYINALMALTYKNRKVPFKPKEIGRLVTESLKKKGIRHIAIWGTSIYTDWLMVLLWETEIIVEYIVDKEMRELPKESLPEKLFRGLKGSNKPRIIKPSDHMYKVDAVIVVDYAHFNSIKQMVPRVYDYLLALTELVE